MGKLIDCIARTEKTIDGMVISGHRFKAELAIIDDDTGRTYLINACLNCSKQEVSWTAHDQFALIDLPKHYPKVITVGCRDDRD